MRTTLDHRKSTYISGPEMFCRAEQEDIVQRIQYYVFPVAKPCLPRPAEQASDSAMTEERVIRRYANRRLYDAAESRHVTLDDIRKMIGAGDRIKVIDDKTDKDVTRSVLLQIIANQEQFGTPVLSTQLLEAIIRFYGNPVQEMLTSYLEQSIGSLLRQQQVMRTEMAKVLESPLAPMADMARQNMELWAKMQASMLSAFTPEATSTKAPPEQPSKPRTRKRRG
jgi:polyhydroxyalkanoate synthesis repressor PhaR